MTTKPRTFNLASITKSNQPSMLLSNRSENSQTTDEAGRNSFSPSAETINRNLRGVESVTDIANIPKQFHGKRYFTPIWDHYPGGNRAVYNLTEQIRQTKEKLHGYDGFQNVRSDWRNREISQESDLQTVNRYAFGEQSLADIRDIKNPFFGNYYGKNLSETSGIAPYRMKNSTHIRAISEPFSPTGTVSTEGYTTLPYAHYTISEIEDINAHPEFVREDQVIGKKAFTREEYEELRGIPSITDNEQTKSPIINRYELPDDEQNDIKNLPDIVDSQYTIGRSVRSTEEIQEIQALPDIHSYSPVSDAKLLTARSISNRPTSDMTSPGLLSAYVAPNMRCMIFALIRSVSF
uniref:ZM domain-containing protein n=1 Tax=Loa loa TaxID=7209 RepID=A0A1I7V5Y1_LOALO